MRGVARLCEAERGAQHRRPDIQADEIALVVCERYGLLCIFVPARLWYPCILERRDEREQASVGNVAIVVDAEEVRVDDPYGPTGLDAQRAQGKHPRSAPAQVSHWDRRKEGKGEAHERAMLRSRLLRTCASSLGGPGLNFDEHIGGRSTLGTRSRPASISVCAISVDDQVAPRKPVRGLDKSGSAISARMPQSTVVSPSLTRADPSADEMEPTLIAGCRAS